MTRIFVQSEINRFGYSEGKNVVEAGEFALLCCWKSLSLTKRSVRIGILKWRVVLSVTQTGEEKPQQGTHQHICTDKTTREEKRKFQIRLLIDENKHVRGTRLDDSN